MKRKGSSAPKRRKPSKKAPSKSNAARVDKSKRGFLRTAAVGLPVVALGGYFTFAYLQSAVAEADLSKVGNGKPSIVQIHDPQCALCATLQDQTKNVLSRFDDSKYEYLVANIKTHKGAMFAGKYGVPHVTLLLFDKRGKLIQIVRGPTNESIIDGALSALLKS
jgi:hypothetical protein